MKPIAIVIGHGPNKDKGAFSRDGKTNELVWNTALALLIHAKLLKLGVKPIIVHRVTERLQPVKETNATGAAAAIELHLNSGGGTGTEMIHFPTSSRGKKLAALLQKGAVAALGLPDRGIKPPFNDRGLRWLRDTSMPAVIVESGFIDHDGDLQRLNERRAQLADAYANALMEFTKDT